MIPDKALSLAQPFLPFFLNMAAAGEHGVAHAPGPVSGRSERDAAVVPATAGRDGARARIHREVCPKVAIPDDCSLIFPLANTCTHHPQRPRMS